MKSKMLLIIALALFALAALVAGCGSGSGSSSSGSTSSGGETTASGTETTSAGGEKKTIFAFLFAPRGTNDASKAWANGFDEAAKELGPGYEVVLKAEDKMDLEPVSYLNFIRSAMVQEPDGIIVIPNTAEGMKSGLEQIQSQYPTKTLIMDSPMEGVEQVAFVGTNNKEAGAEAAEYLIEQFEQKKLPSNEVAVMRWTPGATATDQRLEGFEEAIEASPLKIVATAQPEGGEAAVARNALTDIFTAHPNVGSVYSVTDVLGLGAAQAIAAGHSEVQQVSIDATEEGVQLILEEKGMNAEIAQHLEEVGNTAVNTLAEALEGKKVPPTVYTGTTMVTAANAEEYLKSAKQEAR